MKTKRGLTFSILACTLGFALGLAGTVSAAPTETSTLDCKQCWYTPPQPPNTCSGCHHNCLGGEYICCGCPMEQ